MRDMREWVARWGRFGHRALGLGPASEGDALIMLKTAAAAGIAWAVASAGTGAPRPVLASLAAVLVVQATVYQTVWNGLRRVAGVVLGVLLALALGRWVGLSAWSMVVLLLLALLVGRTFRLADQANQVAVSALLVIVIGDVSGGYAEVRVFETLLGAAVGVVVNLLVAPPIHVQIVRDALADMARRLAGLLDEIGRQLPDERALFTPARTNELLWTAQRFRQEITEMQEQLDRASESLRYNPRRRVFMSPVRKPAPAALLARVKAAAAVVDNVADEIGGITRALADIGEGRAGARWDPATAAQVGELVITAGRAVQAWARTLEADDPTGDKTAESLWNALVGEVEQARTQLSSLSQGVMAHRGKAQPAVVSWLVIGSVLADVSRILAEVDPAGGAHKTAVSATPPARLHLHRPTSAEFRRGLRGFRQRILHRR